MNQEITRIYKEADDPKLRSFKYVGIYLDDRLDFIEHIKYVETKVATNIGIINSAKRSITPKMKIILYKAIVKPYFEYGIELWGNATKNNLKKINYLNKRAVRVICGLPRRESTKIPRMDKCILTLKDIYKFSVLKFGYSVVNEKVPSPILTIFEKEKNNSRRHLNLKIPTFMKTKTQK